MKRPLVALARAFCVGTAAFLAASYISPLAARPVAARIATFRTATFDIKNMTCALCPITVRKAIEGVTGVKSVAVNFSTKMATVMFDSSVTNITTIAAASTNAGYPAVRRP